MKKSLILLSAVAIIALTGCTSAEKPMKEMVITETENQFVMEDIDVSKKTLEELIVFNEEGVTIRKEGNNLVLSMPELVLFDFNKYEVKNKVKGSLNTLAKALEENPDIRINLQLNPVSIYTKFWTVSSKISINWPKLNMRYFNSANVFLLYSNSSFASTQIM